MDRQTMDISYQSFLAALVGLPLTVPTFVQFCSNYQVYLQYGQLEEPASLNFIDVMSNRKKISIDIEQVKEYQANDFTIKEIAHLMGLKKSTLKRTIALHGCNMRTSYSPITDAELDLCITVARQQFPNFGLQLIKGKLTATGLKVQDARLRASYNRVGIKQGYPCKKKIKRRVYTVPGPLALWHLDGFHKFDVFGFVVHGIVDGYTKAIVGMQVSDNNRSETVVRLLHAARLKWGLPACLRIDRGGENVLATDYLFQERGTHYRSVIAGKSVHNQPIERQWKDAKELCLQPLLKEFHDMDSCGVLQSESHLDLFCLHFVGTDLFQRTLVDYVASWNNHPIRTKRCKTPMQLYINGMALLKERQDAGEFQVPCAELLQNENVLHLPKGIFDTEYLETIVGPFRAARDVTKYDCPLNAIEHAELKELVDPTKVELGNIRNQFILAKNFVVFTIHHRELDMA